VVDDSQQDTGASVGPAALLLPVPYSRDIEAEPVSKGCLGHVQLGAEGAHVDLLWDANAEGLRVGFAAGEGPGFIGALNELFSEGAHQGLLSIVI
jgi:hypothetical protein